MRGFSLTEMLVTVALLGVFTGITVTALGPLHSRYRRRQAAEQVAAAAARARLASRETGRCHLLRVFDGSAEQTPGSEVWGDRVAVMRRASADCDIAESAGDPQLVEWVRMPERVSVRVSSAGTPVWLANGRLSGGASQQLQVRVAVDEDVRMPVQLLAHGPVCVDVPVEECP